MRRLICAFVVRILGISYDVAQMIKILTSFASDMKRNFVKYNHGTTDTLLWYFIKHRKRRREVNSLRINIEKKMCQHFCSS